MLILLGHSLTQAGQLPIDPPIPLDPQQPPHQLPHQPDIPLKALIRTIHRKHILIG
jgi:hypothetical protein